MNGTRPRVCVFCGAAEGVRPSYAAAARDVGRRLADAGLGVVCGGGRVGLMGALSDGALDAGGEVLGVIPRALTTSEVAHSGLTELFVVNTMHERKAMMTHLSSGFAVLPGGFGTLEETMEMLTWLQLGFHDKPMGILDVENFFAQLFAFFDHAQDEGFLRSRHRRAVERFTSPRELVAYFVERRGRATQRSAT